MNDPEPPPEDWMSRIDAIRILKISGPHLDRLVGSNQLQTAANAAGDNGVTRSSVEQYLSTSDPAAAGAGNPFSLTSLRRGGKKIIDATIDGLLG